MSAGRPACSVVVRALNEERHIGRLLDGISQQTVRDVEVILVDSGSTDATVEIASRYPVRVVALAPEEFSFGRSLNLGVRAAHGEIVVVASGHVYPLYRDWIERLTSPFADPLVALAYGRQRGNEATRFAERRIFSHWFPESSNPVQEGPFCNNANAAIRRALWEQIPYDETLTGLEDIDWARRALEAGHRIAYVAEAEVAHVHEEGYRRIFNRYRREALALKRIFPGERFGFPDFVRLFSANVLADAGQAVRERVFWKSVSDIIGFRLMQFWGTYRGYARHRPVTSELRRRFYYPAAPDPRSRQRTTAQPTVDYAWHEHESARDREE